MADDIARLGLEIDSSQAVQAKRDMDAAAVSAGSLENSYAGVERAARLGNQSTKGYSDALALAYGVSGKLTASQQNVIRGLEDQIVKVTASGKEYAIYTALRRAGTTADTEAGKAIAGLATQVYALTPAHEKARTSAAGLRQEMRALREAAGLAGGPFGSLVAGVTSLGSSSLHITAPLVGMIALIGAATVTAVKGVEAYTALERVQAQLRNSISFSGSANGLSQNTIDAQVSGIAKASDTDITALRAAALELTRFRRVSGDAFTSALEDAVKLSQTGLMPLAEATKLLGSAFNDPLNGVKQLRDVGFILSPVLETNIRRMTEQGNALGAQKGLIAAVTAQLGNVGGQQGLSGAWQAVTNAGGEWLAQVGREFSEATNLEGVLRGVANELERINKAHQDGSSPGAPKSFFGAIAQGALAGLEARRQGLVPGTPEFNAFVAQNYGLKPKAGSAAANVPVNPLSELMSGFDQNHEAGNQALAGIFGAFAQSAADKQKIDKITEALKYQNETAGKSALQQQILTQQRLAGAAADSAAGRAIAGLVIQQQALRDMQAARQDTARQINQMNTEAGAIGMTAEAAARYTFQQNLINKAREQGREPGAAELALYQQLTNQYGIASDRLIQLQRQQKAINDAVQGFGQVGYDAFNSLIVQGNKLNDVMANLLRSLASMMLQAALIGTGPFAGIAGTASTIPGQTTGGIFGGLFKGFFPTGAGGGGAPLAINSIGGTGLSTSVTGGLYHAGGMFGEASGYRTIPVAAYFNAPRFHDGTMPWDSSFEMPAIIRKDEGVFTPGQMSKLGGVTISIGNITMPDDADGTDPSGSKRAGKIADALRNQMTGVARSEMVRQKAPGGILSK